VIEEFAKRSPAPPSTPPRAVEELTAREREILDLLVRGLSNPEICQRLVISEATAKTHIAHISRNSTCATAFQAVIYAVETGLVAPGSTH
jgi:DNA-binding NarL/FixJ family response regulator